MSTEAEVLATLKNARVDVDGLIDDLDTLKAEMDEMASGLSKRMQDIKGAFDGLLSEHKAQRGRAQKAASLVRTQTEEIGALIASFAERFQHVQAFNVRLVELDGSYAASLEAHAETMAKLDEIDGEAATAFTGHAKSLADEARDAVSAGMNAFKKTVGEAMETATAAADNSAQQITQKLETEMQQAAVSFEKAAESARSTFEQNAGTRNNRMDEIVRQRVESMQSDKSTRTEQLIGKVADIRKMIASISDKLDKATTTMSEGMGAATKAASAAGTGLEVAADIFTNIQTLYTEVEELWDS